MGNLKQRNAVQLFVKKKVFKTFKSRMNLTSPLDTLLDEKICKLQSSSSASPYLQESEVPMMKNQENNKFFTAFQK